MMKLLLLETKLPDVTETKIGESPGMDSISAKMLKCAQNAAIKKLHVLSDKIMAEQKVPSDWRKLLIVKIPKKGNLIMCDNYHGTSLLQRDRQTHRQTD